MSQFLVNTFVEKVYVLSVKTFTDRISHIQSLMNEYQIEFEFVFTHDIPDIKPEESQMFDANTTLTMAQKSLALKHIETWRDAVSKNYRKIMIFEDDVIFNKNFKHHLPSVLNAAHQLPDDYLIFLGGADAKVPDSFLLSKQVLVPLAISTTEAYITDLVAIKRRLAWLNNHKISLPADHLICKIDRETNGANYWSRYPLVEQGSVTGIFGSHLDNNRRKHSKLFNVLRYHWNKFQRHQLRYIGAKIRSYLR